MITFACQTVKLESFGITQLHEGKLLTLEDCARLKTKSEQGALSIILY